MHQSSFDRLFATIVLIVYTYATFTCFFWMGIEGYPHGLWYALECLSEVIMMFHFAMQIVLRNTSWCGKMKEDFFMLHGSVPLTKFQIFELFISSFP